MPFHNKYLKNRIHIKLTLNIDNFFNFGLMFMRFSPKCRVLSGVILELSEKEKFCENFRISGRSFGKKFWISLYILYIFTSPSALDREIFSPKPPSKMTPVLCLELK